ncbi:hypothetical protein N9L68_03695 [bacterium]|nr:hypothetical protein [bacterium]
MATAGLRGSPFSCSFRLPCVSWIRAVRVLTDGGKRVMDGSLRGIDTRHAISGAGWVLWVALSTGTSEQLRFYDSLRTRSIVSLQSLAHPMHPRRESETVRWAVVSCSSVHLGSTTSMQAEAMALLQASHALTQLLTRGFVKLNDLGYVVDE